LKEKINKKILFFYLKKPIIIIKEMKGKHIFIVTLGVIISLLAISMVKNMGRMFTEGCIVVGYWTLGDVIRPLLLVFGILIGATSLISMKNRKIREELRQLRAKYLRILEGKFIKDSPTIEDVRVELASKIKRCKRWYTKKYLLEELFNLSLLRCATQPRYNSQFAKKILQEMEQLGYPGKAKLRYFETNAKRLMTDDYSFFKSLEEFIKRPKRLEPKGQMLQRVIEREFKKDRISSYLEEFGFEEIAKGSTLGVFSSLCVLLLVVGSGIFERLQIAKAAKYKHPLP
jgi:hypothetical protein